MELLAINKEIQRLKNIRLELYGEDWRKKIPKKIKLKVTESEINKYRIYLYEQITRNNYTQLRICSLMGLPKNTFSDLNNGFCSQKTKRIIEAAILNDLEDEV